MVNFYKSQYGQDRYINENYFKNKIGGVFVDIGAHDGESLSNTFFFEKALNWSGICIEPHPKIFSKLKQNRKCILVEGCAWSEDTNKVFRMIEGYSEMLSGIVEVYEDQHVERINKEVESLNQKTTDINMKCYDINKLLLDNNFKKIDFLSLDIEGGELEVLKCIDFYKFNIKTIAVENNYENKDIRNLLFSKGYNLVNRLHTDDIFVIHPEVEIIKNYFTDQDNLTIFDIGACDFKESIIFKSSFKNSKVYSFEPDSYNIDKFSQNAIRFGIEVLPIALSDSDGEVLFYPSDNLNGKTWKNSGSIAKPVIKEGTSEGIFHDGLEYDLKGCKVKSKRFDTFCIENNINNIDYLHIDVQGAEMKVLKCLGDFRPKLIFAETSEFETYETGTNLEDFDNFMKDLGYIIKNRFKYDTLYEFYGS